MHLWEYIILFQRSLSDSFWQMHYVTAAAITDSLGGMCSKISFWQFLADWFCDCCCICYWFSWQEWWQKIAWVHFPTDAFCDCCCLTSSFCLAGCWKRSLGKLFWQMHSVTSCCHLLPFVSRGAGKDLLNPYLPDAFCERCCWKELFPEKDFLEANFWKDAFCKGQEQQQ